MQIKSFTPENKIPQGLLSGGVEAIREGLLARKKKKNIYSATISKSILFLALGNFQKAKNADKENERRPDTPRVESKNKRLHDLRASQESLGELIKFEE